MTFSSRFTVLGVLLIVVASGAPRFASAQAQIFSDFSTCACSTTADFESQAQSRISVLAGQGNPGGFTGFIGPGQVAVTLAISSTTSPQNAFIQINATITPNIKVGAQIFISSITPVDASRNSLAGESEIDQGLTRAVIDVQIYGTQRDNPWFCLKGHF